jgi:hypothetical protein
MGNLLDRMHAGVGTAGTLDEYVALGELAYCCLQRVLDRLPVRLGLPALPGCAVILNADCNAFQLLSDK